MAEEKSRNPRNAVGAGAESRAVLKFFAVAPPGLEQMVLEELTALGISDPAPSLDEGGVAFSGELPALWRANLNLRIASRVLVRMSQFHATAFHELERHARKVRWGDFLSRGTAFNLRVTARKSKLYHSDAIAQRFSEAIEQKTGAKMSDAPGSQLFVIRMFHDKCLVSADSSGAHLHMRGYREALAKAPMRETLAAALVHAAQWKGDSHLVDPMCGAGTIPIEAALIARNIPPGLARNSRQPRAYSFERWPSHDHAAWIRIVENAREEIKENSSVNIVASDRDQGAIEATYANAERAGVAADLRISQRSVSAVEAIPGQGVLIFNPPYGKRVGEVKALRNLYASVGSIVRKNFPLWPVVLLSGNSVLDRQMGLELETIARTTNGGIPVRIVGSR